MVVGHIAPLTAALVEHARYARVRSHFDHDRLVELARGWIE
jgi:hypothetical protein